MRIPDNSDTDLTPATIEATVSKAMVEQDGKKIIDYSKVPEELLDIPGAKVALETELRRRYSQADYTRSRQELAELKAKVKTLETKLPEVNNIPMPQEFIDRQEALDDLKLEDIDEWYNEKRKLEADIEAYKKEQIESIYSEATKNATQASMLAEREVVLHQFNEANPEKPLTIDLLDKYTPPAILQKLSAGEISFDDAIKIAHSVVYGIGATANPEDPGMVSLGEVGSSSGEQAPISIQDTAIY